MASASAILQDAIAALEQNERNSYCYVAATIFCSYDTLLSLGQEIRHIWGSKPSPITILYFIVRYYTLINLITMTSLFLPFSVDISLKACKQYFFWEVGIAPPVLIFALDAILLLRIVALYNRSKRVFTILSILVLGDFGAALWTHMALARELSSAAMVAPIPWQGCAAKMPAVKFWWAAFILNFALSLLFLAMTLWKLVENHQVLHGKLTWRSLLDTDNMSPLLYAFVRDGSIFFALTFANTLLKIITSYAVDKLTQTAFFPWILTIYSYSGSHLILGLRAAGAKGSANQPWSETLSFQPRPDGFRHDQSHSFTSTSVRSTHGLGI